MEALKVMPFGAVWNFYCESSGFLTDIECIDEVLKYEKNIIMKR